MNNTLLSKTYENFGPVAKPQVKECLFVFSVILWLGLTLGSYRGVLNQDFVLASSMQSKRQRRRVRVGREFTDLAYSARMAPFCHAASQRQKPLFWGKRTAVRRHSHTVFTLYKSMSEGNKSRKTVGCPTCVSANLKRAWSTILTLLRAWVHGLEYLNLTLWYYGSSCRTIIQPICFRNALGASSNPHFVALLIFKYLILLCSLLHLQVIRLKSVVPQAIQIKSPSCSVDEWRSNWSIFHTCV